MEKRLNTTSNIKRFKGFMSGEFNNESRLNLTSKYNQQKQPNKEYSLNSFNNIKNKFTDIKNSLFSNPKTITKFEKNLLFQVKEVETKAMSLIDVQPKVMLSCKSTAKPSTYNSPITLPVSDEKKHNRTTKFIIVKRKIPNELNNILKDKELMKFHSKKELRLTNNRGFFSSINKTFGATVVSDLKEKIFAENLQSLMKLKSLNFSLSKKDKFKELVKRVSESNKNKYKLNLFDFY